MYYCTVTATKDEKRELLPLFCLVVEVLIPVPNTVYIVYYIVVRSVNYFCVLHTATLCSRACMLHICFSQNIASTYSQRYTLVVLHFLCTFYHSLHISRYRYRYILR